MKMKRRSLLTVLILIGLLRSGRGALAAETALQTAPGRPVQAQAADSFYIIEWSIQAVGHQEIQQAPKTREIHHREIKITGSAVSRKSSSGEITTIPMELTLTDDSYDHYTLDCYETYRWKSITDPGRYNGGPDPTWTGGILLLKLCRNDGSVWGMENPFSPPVFTEWQTYRSFNYHTLTKDIDCDGSTTTYSYDQEHHDYDNILWPLEEMPLEADSTGKIFTLDTEYTTESGIPPSP